MFLVDSNIWLEPLLDQKRAAECKAFLETVDRDLLAITDFALFSIALRLLRIHGHDLYRAFIEDLFGPRGVNLLHVTPSQLMHIVELVERHNLDFDDGCQYMAAEVHDLKIVSFDTDFDQMPRGRVTPTEAIALFHNA